MASWRSQSTRRTSWKRATTRGARRRRRQIWRRTGQTHSTPACEDEKSERDTEREARDANGREGRGRVAAVLVVASVAMYGSVCDVDAAQLTSTSSAAFSAIIHKAMNRALGGGLAGGAAMAINVCTLMWMRTTVNFQYRYGMDTFEAFRHLYKEGGIPRFYRGLIPALAQAPISRFGDTAANAGMLALWDEIEATKDLPVFAKTLSASLAAASFRYFLMPIDACKTIMQVEGKGGFSALVNKVRVGGPGVLWAGGAGAVAATFVGHYPWFFTYNTLIARVPEYESLATRLLVNAVIGFCASAVSDTCSNSLRVMKTTAQTSDEPITYVQAFRMVVEKDGLYGLFFRGLSTKIVSNGIQGLLFSVLWKLCREYLDTAIQ